MGKLIFVLGMHRSGTSAMAGCLSHAGIYMGSELKAAKSSNSKGHFENKKILAFNVRVLKKSSSSWRDPRPFSTGQISSIMNYSRKLRKLLDREYSGKQLTGLKEPRCSLLLPLYMEAFSGLDIEVKSVVMRRPMAEIAGSLHKRNGISLKKAEQLSAKYHRMIDQYAGDDVLNIEFSDLVKKPIETLKEVEEFVGDKFIEGHVGAIQSFIDPRLKHF